MSTIRLSPEAREHGAEVAAGIAGNKSAVRLLSQRRRLDPDAVARALRLAVAAGPVHLAAFCGAVQEAADSPKWRGSGSLLREAQLANAFDRLGALAADVHRELRRAGDAAL